MNSPAFDLSNHFDDKMLLIEKYDPAKIYTVVHIDGKSKNYMVKRFMFDNLALRAGKQASSAMSRAQNWCSFLLIYSLLQKSSSLRGRNRLPETIELDLIHPD